MKQCLDGMKEAASAYAGLIDKLIALSAPKNSKGDEVTAKSSASGPKT